MWVEESFIGVEGSC